MAFVPITAAGQLRILTGFPCAGPEDQRRRWVGNTRRAQKPQGESLPPGKPSESLTLHAVAQRFAPRRTVWDAGGLRQRSAGRPAPIWAGSTLLDGGILAQRSEPIFAQNAACRLSDRDGRPRYKPVTNPETSTRGIRIRVATQYKPEHSAPNQHRWFFAYHIHIANEGSETVQLISRKWVITDANGEIRHVEGPGVVGQQPVLTPGSAFEYTSACPLETPFGSMYGTYRMTTPVGESFDAAIPAFPLRIPGAVH